LGETDPAEDKVNHTLTVLTAAIDPICPPSLEFDSEYGREVYMVEQGGKLSEKITKEIQREAKKEIACAEHLARELDKRKGHNGFQDNSGGSEDEHRDGPPSWRHHLKFESQRRTDREQL
jgi:hypothetical protein